MLEFDGSYWLYGDFSFPFCKTHGDFPSQLRNLGCQPYEVTSCDYSNKGPASGLVAKTVLANGMTRGPRKHQSPPSPLPLLTWYRDDRIKGDLSPWRCNVLPSSFDSEVAEAKGGQCPVHGHPRFGGRQTNVYHILFQKALSRSLSLAALTSHVVPTLSMGKLGLVSLRSLRSPPS